MTQTMGEFSKEENLGKGLESEHQLEEEVEELGNRTGCSDVLWQMWNTLWKDSVVQPQQRGECEVCPGFVT